jgi:hypothetical protein
MESASYRKSPLASAEVEFNIKNKTGEILNLETSTDVFNSRLSTTQNNSRLGPKVSNLYLQYRANLVWISGQPDKSLKLLVAHCFESKY